MASLIPGYNYDIFISYRQKDNKYDGWVTEFVDNLKKELEATFKEEISVYFDVNPHDGLLETHDVDESLKEKLKCLVFIPIISRTYCDPKSFAWEHEFKAFVDQASKDQFGLKVKLPNGNVASRVLPVRIHDLVKDDVKLCESVLGGFLRGVEFVYKSPGVNRPLRSGEDNPHDNLNRTIYRDQINKVALAINEIITGLMKSPDNIISEKVQKTKIIPDLDGEKRKPKLKVFPQSFRGKAITRILIVIISAIILSVLYLKIFRKNTLESKLSSGEKISVAVMPFQNLTNDSLWNIWRDGIQDNLITALSNSTDLKVRHKESVNRLLQKESTDNYASLLPSIAKIISKKLEVDIFVSGSINKSGRNSRLNAQVVDLKADEVLKSFQIDGSSDEMLFSIDSLSSMVMNFLVISKLVRELPPYLQSRPLTTSPEAYRCYLQGQSARSKRDYETARKMFSKALAIDSNYHHMKLLMSVAFMNEGDYEEARKWSDMAYEKIDQMPVLLKILMNANHAFFHATPAEETAFLEQYLEIDDKFPGTWFDIGLNYGNLLQFDKAIPYYEKALEIFDDIKMKPWWIYYYLELGYAYHETSQYRKEEKLYKKANEDFPDDPSLIWRKAILYLTLRDTSSANKYLRQYRSIYKENAWSEAALERNLGWAYKQANMPDQAEEAFRKSVSLDSNSPWWTYYLAYFLIDHERNIEEGLKLADKTLELSKGEFEWTFLDCKGWGLYKKGNYKEALDILQKSWDIRRARAQYDHEAYLHLEAAKKAVANQKNN